MQGGLLVQKICYHSHLAKLGVMKSLVVRGEENIFAAQENELSSTISVAASVFDFYHDGIKMNCGGDKKDNNRTMKN